MKKIYITPDTTVVYVQASQLLTNSLGDGNTPKVSFDNPNVDNTEEGYDADARGFFGFWEEEVVDKRNNDDFDDYEDEI